MSDVHFSAHSACCSSESCPPKCVDARQKKRIDCSSTVGCAKSSPSAESCVPSSRRCCWRAPATFGGTSTHTLVLPEYGRVYPHAPPKTLVQASVTTTTRTRQAMPPATAKLHRGVVTE